MQVCSGLEASHGHGAVQEAQVFGTTQLLPPFHNSAGACDKRQVSIVSTPGAVRRAEMGLLAATRIQSARLQFAAASNLDMYSYGTPNKPKVNNLSTV